MNRLIVYDFVVWKVTERAHGFCSPRKFTDWEAKIIRMYADLDEGVLYIQLQCGEWFAIPRLKAFEPKPRFIPNRDFPKKDWPIMGCYPGTYDIRCEFHDDRVAEVWGIDRRKLKCQIQNSVYCFTFDHMFKEQCETDIQSREDVDGIGGKEMTNTEAPSESLSKALEIALVDAIKTHSLRYCKNKRKFYVTRNMKEHVPQVILKRGFVCEYMVCIHRDNCLAVALKEGLKEDLLEFHRAWHRSLSLERSLTIYDKR